MTEEDSHDWRLLRFGEARCDRCVFWCPLKPDEGLGDCRRHAPTRQQKTEFEEEAGYNPLWPLTCDNEWCGEFRSRDNQ